MITASPQIIAVFFIIDTDKKKLLYHTFVSHGINSGNLYATQFSNIVDSKQTSLGTYRVAEAYHGKYGLSLRLDGMSPSNSNARKRAIVLHGAKYAEPSTIKKLGMLGRSWGCPAIPMKLTKKSRQLVKRRRFNLCSCAIVISFIVCKMPFRKLDLARVFFFHF